VDRLDALGDQALRGTLLYVRAHARPATADEVAGALAVPRTVARSRLERLAAAGLLATSFERRSGRSGPGAGRPAKTYAAAVETSAIEFPPRHYERLVGCLIRTLPPRAAARQLGEAGSAFGRELAHAARLRRGTNLSRGLTRLCSGLGRLGFQATLESVSPHGAVIVSATCPLRPLLLAEPRARAIDEAMWRGLLAATASEQATAGIVCRTHGCLDANAPCRIVVDFARSRARRGAASPG
jgi:predicted ArsR family transcriptional regulator